jgi:hypothetical protein
MPLPCRARPGPHLTCAEPRAGTARLFAAALLAMLRWWMERAERPSPREMDARFHEVV